MNREYEAGGVAEYWLLDPRRQTCIFYRLDERGHFHPYYEDDHGDYLSPRLPQFRLPVPTLMRATLPSTSQIVEAINTWATP